MKNFGRLALIQCELSEGPHNIITSWTANIKYAKSVAKFRGVDMILSIGIKQKDVIALPIPVLDERYVGKIHPSTRESEILVYDYFGKYKFEKTAVLS